MRKLLKSIIIICVFFCGIILLTGSKPVMAAETSQIVSRKDISNSKY